MVEAKSLNSGGTHHLAAMVVDHIIMTQNRCLNRLNFQKLLNHASVFLEGLGPVCFPRTILVREKIMRNEG